MVTNSELLLVEESGLRCVCITVLRICTVCALYSILHCVIPLTLLHSFINFVLVCTTLIRNRDTYCPQIITLMLESNSLFVF